MNLYFKFPFFLLLFQNVKSVKSLSWRFVYDLILDYLQNWKVSVLILYGFYFLFIYLFLCIYFFFTVNFAIQFKEVER